MVKCISHMLGLSLVFFGEVVNAIREVAGVWVGDLLIDKLVWNFLSISNIEQV